ncbi:hypothetical protein Tco_0536498 [Tanacetum coccineum]
MQLMLIAYLLPPLVYTLVRPLMTTTVVNNSVFRAEDKLNYLEHPIPAAPVPTFARQQVPLEALTAHAAWVKRQKEIELKTLFSQQAEQELLQTVREFHACKQEERQSEYDSFVQNYNMQDMGKTINELHAMLKLHEQTLPKKDAPALHVFRAGKVKVGKLYHQANALSWKHFDEKHPEFASDHRNIMVENGVTRAIEDGLNEIIAHINILDPSMDIKNEDKLLLWRLEMIF